MKQRILLLLTVLMLSASQSLWATHTVEIGTSLMVESTGTIAVDKTSCESGDIVTVTPSPATGYAIDFVKYLDKDTYYEIATIEPVNGVYSFTMPDKDVVVIAAFMKLLSNADITISAIDDQTYTGVELKPAVTVKDGEDDITSQCDITYSNNIYAGTATVTIKAKTGSNYTGETSTTFTIKTKSIENAHITLSPGNFTYNGENQKPSVSVKDGDTDLVLDTDYTLTNDGGTNVGEYTVTVTGKDNYDSQTTASKTFNITALETTPTVTLTETSVVYDGTEKKPAVTVTVVLPGAEDPTELTTDDYDVAYSDNVNVGENTAKATVTLKGNYVGQNTATFTITPKSIANATITLSATSYEYDGAEHKPAVSLVKLEATELTADQDYTVSYPDDCTSPGEKTVTVSGKGMYCGTATATFTIAKLAPEVTAPTAIDGLVYNGEAQALVKAGSTTGGTLKYSLDGKKWSNSIPKKANAGTYDVYYMVEGDDEYEGIDKSDANKVSVTIAKAEITMVILSQMEFDYTGSAQSPTVTEVYAGKLEVGSDWYQVGYPLDAIEPGEYAITVSAKNVSGNNFTGSATAKFTIKGTDKIDPVITLPKAISGLVYNGQPQELVTPGVCKEGIKSSYKIQQGGKLVKDCGEDIPTITNAGIYNVVWTVENDVKNRTVTCLVEIAQAEIKKVELDKTELTLEEYNTQKPKVTKVYAGENSALEVGEEWYEVEYPSEVTKPDEYEVKVSTINKDGQNFIGSATATFTITGTGKIDPEVTAPKAIDNLVYNGQPQALIEAGKCSEGTKMLYKIYEGPETDTEWSEEIPKATKAVAYGILWKVEGNDIYNSTDEKDIGVAIAQAEITKVELDKTALTLEEYNTTKPKVTKVYGGENSDIVLPESDYDITYPETVSKPDDYEITVSAKTGNVTGSATATFTITPSPEPEPEPEPEPQVLYPTITRVPTAKTDLVFNNTRQKLIEPGAADHGTMQYRFVAVPYGSIPSDDDGKDGIEGATSTNGLTGAGDKDKPGKTGAIGDSGNDATGAEGDKDATGATIVLDDMMWGTEIPEAELPGEYTIAYMVKGDEGYGDIPEQTLKVTIASNVEAKENADGSLTVTGVADGAKNLDVIAIPATINGKYVTELAPGAFDDDSKAKVIQFPKTSLKKSGQKRTIKINPKSVGKHYVQTDKEDLADYAGEENLQETLKADKLFAELPANYQYQTFSCGIDVKIPKSLETLIAHYNHVNIADHLRLYTCKVKDGAVIGSRISDEKLKVNGEWTLKKNNGVLVSWSTQLDNLKNEYKNDPLVVMLIAQYSESQAEKIANDYDEDNMLIPVTKTGNFKNDNDYTYYMLYSGKFHKIADNDSETSGCKALLRVPTSMEKAASARSLTIRMEDDEATGIKAMDNEKWTMDNWYDMQGRKIQKPTKKGLYIHNGVKEVVK